MRAGVFRDDEKCRLFFVCYFDGITTNVLTDLDGAR